MEKLPAITGDMWFNSNPLTLADTEGKVVLVDFWNYACANCLRALPYLRTWWEKYRDKGLVIIGIHAPEFEFEKDPKNVAQAIKELGVDWPVVLDSDYTNWNNFSNRYWPAEYIANRRGDIVYNNFGEGHYIETERVIQGLLTAINPKAPLPDIRAEEHKHNKDCIEPTPELYLGYGQGAIVNPEGYWENQFFDYSEPDKMPENSIGLAGKWLATEEYIESSEENALLKLNFKATEVNLIMRPEGKFFTKAQVLFNNKPLPQEIRGLDIKFYSEVEIGKATVYNLLKSKIPTEGILKIIPKKGNFQAYAFTFFGCKE